MAEDTPVLTPDGFRPLGDIRKGDLVFHPNGRKTEVLGVSEEKEADIVLTFKHCEPIVCASSQVFYFQDLLGERFPYRFAAAMDLAEEGLVTEHGEERWSGGEHDAPHCFDHDEELFGKYVEDLPMPKYFVPVAIEQRDPVPARALLVEPNGSPWFGRYGFYCVGRNHISICSKQI